MIVAARSARRPARCRACCVPLTGSRHQNAGSGRSDLAVPHFEAGSLKARERRHVGARKPGLAAEAGDARKKGLAPVRVEMGNRLIEKEEGRHSPRVGNEAGLGEQDAKEKRLLLPRRGVRSRQARCRQPDFEIIKMGPCARAASSAVGGAGSGKGKCEVIVAGRGSEQGAREVGASLSGKAGGKARDSVGARGRKRSAMGAHLGFERLEPGRVWWLGGGEQAVALAKCRLVARCMAGMAGVEGMRKAVEKAPACRRPFQEQPVHQRGEPEDRQPLGQAGERCSCAFGSQQAPLGGLGERESLQADRGEGRLRCEGRADPEAAAAAAASHVGKGCTAQAAADCEQRHSFKECGLPCAIWSGKQDDSSPPGVHAGCSVVAEVGKGKREKRRVSHVLSALAAPVASSYSRPVPKALDGLPPPMNTLAGLINFLVYVLQLLIWVIIIQAVLSWLIAFNVVNMRNRFVAAVYDGLDRVLAPILQPIRRRLPDLGGIDVSPLVVILAIVLAQQLLQGLRLDLLAN